MFPLKGILHGKPYTYAWASYLALFYLIIGIWYASPIETRLFGIMISVLSLMFFIGSVFFARFKAKAIKQSAETNEENAA